GGAVRDTVLGRAVADVDVAVPSGALDLARRCAERLGGTCVVLDAERGAARVVTDGGLTLDLTDFRAPSLEGDLAARDFTVDALAVPLAPLLARGRAAIVDPTGGLADLKARRLRPAGAGVLDDDPLRALRGVRLEATLGLRLTAAAARAARQAAPRGARAVLRARRARRAPRARHRGAAAAARAGDRGRRARRPPSPATDAPRPRRRHHAARALPLLPRPARGHARSVTARARRR